MFQAHVFPGEEPVIIPTIVAELADVSPRAGMFMPSATGVFLTDLDDATVIGPPGSGEALSVALARQR